MNIINSAPVVNRPVDNAPLYGYGGAVGDAAASGGAEQAVRAAEYSDHTSEGVGTAGASQTGAGFSDMFAEALREELARLRLAAGVTAGVTADASAGLTDGLDPYWSSLGLTDMRSQGLEQMILESASAGEASNSQMALLMLLMIMQMGESDVGSSMMMQVMSVLLTQLENESPVQPDAQNTTGMHGTDMAYGEEPAYGEETAFGTGILTGTDMPYNPDIANNLSMTFTVDPTQRAHLPPGVELPPNAEIEYDEYFSGGPGGEFTTTERGTESMINPPSAANTPNTSGTSSIADREVFQAWLPGGGTGTVKLPLAVWTAATPAITSTEDNRSADRYRSLLDQFRVETAARYRPGRDGFTYCNIFVLDVTRAMGVHIPQMGAIAMDKWLSTEGAEYGWREVDAETAQRYANEGKPAVTTSGENGHVQMVAPSRDGEFDPERGVAIAQAGGTNTNYAYITETYGASGMRQVRYFVND